MTKQKLITFEALKAEMKVKKITQQQVSKYVKAEDRHLWKTIKNCTVRLETLQKICEFLDLELYLVNPNEDVETKIG